MCCSVDIETDPGGARVTADRVHALVVAVVAAFRFARLLHSELVLSA